MPKKLRNDTQDDGPSSSAKRHRPTKRPALGTKLPGSQSTLTPGTGRLSSASTSRSGLKVNPTRTEQLPTPLVASSNLTQIRTLPSPRVALEPSPTVSDPSPLLDEQEDYKDILDGLRESFSAKHDFPISDAELASLIYDRRNGLNDLRHGDRLGQEDYLKVEFVHSRGREKTQP